MIAPKISIVTPCYNSTGFLERLHASLCRQSYRNFEWIAVDDSSTDATVGLLESLSSPGEGGMRAYALPQNSGGGVAAGYGVEQATGEIVLIVDHDDELEDFALQTVASEWSVLSSRDELGGMFFRRSNPSTGEVIGDVIEEGVEFSMSWQANTKPSITDGVIAFRRTAALPWFNARALEPICLFGVPLNQMTKHYKLRAGSARPILRYHRDNPHSQTNFVKVSRKTVYTYAKYIDAWDVYYFLRPGHWIRHVIALQRFSLMVHGSLWYYLRYIDSLIVRIVSIVFMPIAVLRSAVAPPLNILKIPLFDFNLLEGLQDIRAANRDDVTKSCFLEADSSALNPHDADG